MVLMALQLVSADQGVAAMMVHLQLQIVSTTRAIMIFTVHPAGCTRVVLMNNFLYKICEIPYS